MALLSVLSLQRGLCIPLSMQFRKVSFIFPSSPKINTPCNNTPFLYKKVKCNKLQWNIYNNIIKHALSTAAINVISNSLPSDWLQVLLEIGNHLFSIFAKQNKYFKYTDGTFYTSHDMNGPYPSNPTVLAARSCKTKQLL